MGNHTTCKEFNLTLKSPGQLAHPSIRTLLGIGLHILLGPTTSLNPTLSPRAQSHGSSAPPSPLSLCQRLRFSPPPPINLPLRTRLQFLAMVMPPRSCSAGMRSIRRELQRRRSKKPLVPIKSSAAAAKKLSAQPPREDRSDEAGGKPRSLLPCREAPSSSSTISYSRGTAASPQPPCFPISPPLPARSTASSDGSVCRSTPAAAAAHLKPGTRVGVRTRTTTLKTGQVLVLWLKAVVVSWTQEGYEVVYVGNWPPSNPYATVHVPRHHVRLIKTSPPSPTTTTPPPFLPPSAATSSCTAARKKEMRPEPRPTTAGKKLRLIRNLAPEMEHVATSFLTGY